jgi:hypothetical protein
LYIILLKPNPYGKPFKQAKTRNNDVTMKTEPFKLLIVAIIIISIAAIGISATLLIDNLKNIPSGENGLIVSKSVITANESMIELSGGKTLYISNNTPLYLSLQENQTYSFNCIYNYYTKTEYIENAQISK